MLVSRGSCISGCSAEQQLHIARQASVTELRVLARDYDWDAYPEAVLGWMMAHKSIDLASALTVFLNGDPERFNYLSKYDVPEEHRCAARVLDNICLRLNSGFYQLRTSQTFREEERLKRWLSYQSIDRREARRGRWILDETIVGAVFADAPKPATNELPKFCEADEASLGASLFDRVRSFWGKRRLGARSSRS